ncbi:MAG: IS1595 family transposase [Rhodospirillales bacterium]|nr:IS1595 family transposase [Rhodospirillales bacterium]
MSKHKAPGKSDREGISLFELTEMFPDEQSAVDWFEGLIWHNERYCPRCGGFETKPVPKKKPMPYWCKDCRKYFSVRTGTVLECSRLPLRKWVFAIYLVTTNLKSVSSMKLHRDLNVTQKTAWFLIHRIREAWADDSDVFDGTVEIDETFVGGKVRNMDKHKRRGYKSGKHNMATVVGIKERESNKINAQVVPTRTRKDLFPFIEPRVTGRTTIYTDEAAVYASLHNHDIVNHSIEEYVKGQVHINGIESFWSMLKRAHKGTFHKLSAKHLQRYVNEFAGKHCTRNQDTIHQMQGIVVGLVGKRLMYRDLVA